MRPDDLYCFSQNRGAGFRAPVKSVGGNHHKDRICQWPKNVLKCGGGGGSGGAATVKSIMTTWPVLQSRT